MAASLLSACAARGPEMETVDYVDLDRFMGKWYVIANIPTFLEKDAYNAVETYTMNDDGTIDTEFTFRKGGFDGELKDFNPKGFVKDTESNALWGSYSDRTGPEVFSRKCKTGCSRTSRTDDPGGRLRRDH